MDTSSTSLNPLARLLAWFKSRKKSHRVLLLGVVALCVLVGLPLIKRMLLGNGTGDAGEPLLAAVESGEFIEEVVEPGEIESSRNVEIRCEVQSRAVGGTAILELVPEGTYVKKGDLLAKLDDSTLQSDLLAQQIVVHNSHAFMIQAQADVEAAKAALKEYENNLFRQEEDVLESAEFVAIENVRRAEEYLRYSERMAARGYVSDTQLEADRFSVEKARKDLEVAKARLDILRKYTRQRTTNKLQVDVETAEARLRSRESTFKLDTLRLEQIKDQISKCVIRAPGPGQVVYANDSRSRSPASDVLIGEGRTVRERQIMFRLPDARRMRVVAKINEARINRIKAGMPTRIKVDALPNQELEGKVSKVSEYPLPPSSTLTAHIKEYATEIDILEPPGGLRSGMTAEVAIQVGRYANAIYVPLPAVFERKGRLFCLIQNLDLEFEAREVRIGAANDKFVVVRQGLGTNEHVVLNPNRFDSQVAFPPPLTDPAPKARAITNAPSATPSRGAVAAGNSGTAALSSSSP